MKVLAPEIAQMFGVTQRTIHNWAAKDGLPVERHVKGNQYDTRQCIDWYCDWKTGRTLDLSHERARLAHAQANAKEIENAQLAGELVPVEEMARLADVCAITSNRVMGIASTAAPRVLGLDDVRSVNAVIEQCCRDALSALEPQILFQAMGIHPAIAAQAKIDADATRGSLSETDDGIERGAWPLEIEPQSRDGADHGCTHPPRDAPGNRDDFSSGGED